MSQHELTSKEIKLQIEIESPLTKVWHAIINEVDAWWQTDFYFYEDSKIVLEPFPGGRLYEDGGENGAGLWYNVLNINPQESIRFVGHLAPQFGGPATTFLNLSLQEEDGRTVLQVTDSLFGALQKGTDDQLEQGWKLLFEEGLKAYLEK